MKAPSLYTGNWYTLQDASQLASGLGVEKTCKSQVPMFAQYIWEGEKTESESNRADSWEEIGIEHI